MANAIQNFKTILNRVKNIDKLSSESMNKLSKDIQEEVKVRYATTDKFYSYEIIDSSQVSVDRIPFNGKSTEIRIEAGHEIMFIEFGTGYVGLFSNYDQSKLPASGVPITGFWDYYYPSPYKFTTKDGRRGWFHIDFHEGQPAGKQIYDTMTSARNKKIFSQNMHNEIFKGIEING